MVRRATKADTVAVYNPDALSQAVMLRTHAGGSLVAVLKTYTDKKREPRDITYTTT